MTTPSPATNPAPADAIHFRSLGIELRDLLIHAKRAVDEEVGTYPTPIPRCDAQFNHLYERRVRIAGMLDRIGRALDRVNATEDLVAAVVEFAAAPPITESADEQRLRQRLGVVLPDGSFTPAVAAPGPR